MYADTRRQLNCNHLPQSPENRDSGEYNTEGCLVQSLAPTPTAIVRARLGERGNDACAREIKLVSVRRALHSAAQPNPAQ